MVTLLLRKAAAIRLLVNLSIDTLHVLLQKKNKLNFNLLGTQLNTCSARDLSLWGTFQRWIMPLLCRGLFIFLKESLSGAGTGASDRFLAAVVWVLLLRAKLSSRAPVTMVALLSGGNKEMINPLLCEMSVNQTRALSQDKQDAGAKWEAGYGPAMGSAGATRTWCPNFCFLPGLGPVCPPT